MLVFDVCLFGLWAFSSRSDAGRKLWEATLYCMLQACLSLRLSGMGQVQRAILAESSLAWAWKVFKILKADSVAMRADSSSRLMSFCQRACVIQGQGVGHLPARTAG